MTYVSVDKAPTEHPNARVYVASHRYDYWAIDQMRPRRSTGAYGDPIPTKTRKLSERVAADLNEAYEAGTRDGNGIAPSIVKGYPVVACVPTKALGPMGTYTYVVTCLRDLPEGRNYHTWHVWLDERGNWTAEHGHDDMSRTDALADMMRRLEL